MDLHTELYVAVCMALQRKSVKLWSKLIYWFGFIYYLICWCSSQKIYWSKNPLRTHVNRKRS